MRVERIFGALRTVFAALGVFVFVLLALAVVLTSSGGRFGGSKVSVVSLEGIIIDPQEVCLELKKLGERDDVKAVVLRINSPGGAVGPSQEIHSEVRRLSKSKTVVASLSTVAASGGYYAAVGANKIVANSGTITGSIGVIVEFVNASELLNKIGLKGYVVKSGRFKDTGSPFRKMDHDEEAHLQTVINDVNSQFIKAVADGRRMKVEDVERIADGRIFTGTQARGLGLVDEIGDLTDAVELGAKLAGIEGKPFVEYPARRGFDLRKVVFGDALSSGWTDLFSGLRIMYLTPTPDK